MDNDFAIRIRTFNQNSRVVDFFLEIVFPTFLTICMVTADTIHLLKIEFNGSFVKISCHLQSNGRENENKHTSGSNHVQQIPQ